MSVLEALQARVGQDLGVSDWLLVDQDRIDRFAEATGDYQWIHVDRERAASGPFGGTIAHGYLTLSLLPAMSSASWLDMPGVLGGLNYGADKIRFITPVRSGKRIRNRSKLLSVEDRGFGRLLIATESTVEIEGEDKPAMVAVTLAMVLTEM